MNPFRYHVYYRMVDGTQPSRWAHVGSYAIRLMAEVIADAMIKHHGVTIETLTHEGERDDSSLPN